ncbi:MAG: hypothetical protein Q8M88_05120 [Phenylobacterium sp.]|uniref:hypothetical protein n=1 Tax=Phenylobacterium sp. TaxID=1871053 RepID=UPI0027343EB6|nr:hypothetical protein [Phenylobacterium sp.]MDP3173796.1 hypothetical protein [Phenylobacterium sp.]
MARRANAGIGDGMHHTPLAILLVVPIQAAGRRIRAGDPFRFGPALFACKFDAEVDSTILTLLEAHIAASALEVAA